MSWISKSFAVGCLLPTVVAGGVTLAQPAAASTYSVVCDNTSSYNIFCDLYGPASNEAWTIDGNAYSDGNNNASIGFACAPPYRYTMTVSFLDDTGTPQSLQRGSTCRSGPSE